MWGGAWILASLEGGWWCRDQKGESSVCLSFFSFFSLSLYLSFLSLPIFSLSMFPYFFFVFHVSFISSCLL